MTAPKMPERPTAYVSHETVYGNRYSEFNDALDYGQAMYEYGRQQMREECIAICRAKSDEWSLLATDSQPSIGCGLWEVSEILEKLP